MTQIDFQLPPLSSDDQILVDAYQSVGMSVDELAYSEEFEKLAHSLGRDGSLPEKQELYRRLLDLRKRGRLPRRYTAS